MKTQAIKKGDYFIPQRFTTEGPINILSTDIQKGTSIQAILYELSSLDQNSGSPQIGFSNDNVIFFKSKILCISFMAAFDEYYRTEKILSGTADLIRINRVEVIDESGRAYVKYFKEGKVEVLLQDDLQTLKVVITNKPNGSNKTN